MPTRPIDDFEDGDVTEIAQGSPAKEQILIDTQLVRTELASVEAATSSRTDEVAYEIWTRNRVYHVTGEMRCIGVVDRATRTADPGHALLGAKLVGGQRRYQKTLHLSWPLPVPGTEAVFQRPLPDGKPAKGRKNSVTSKVERIVQRLHLTTIVTAGQAEEAFDDVTSHYLGRR